MALYNGKKAYNTELNIKLKHFYKCAKKGRYGKATVQQYRIVINAMFQYIFEQIAKGNIDQCVLPLYFGSIGVQSESLHPKEYAKVVQFANCKNNAKQIEYYKITKFKKYKYKWTRKHRSPNPVYNSYSVIFHDVYNQILEHAILKRGAVDMFQSHIFYKEFIKEKQWNLRNTRT
jgi:hypothetical protein